MGCQTLPGSITRVINYDIYLLDASSGQGVGHHALQEGLLDALLDVLLSGQTPECLHGPPDGLHGALQSRL